MVDEGNISCCTSTTLYMGMCLGIGLCCKWKYGLCKQTADYRTKLRRKFNLAEGPALDWVTHFCCHCCALCQEYRELQSRGFHPSLGWNKNEARNREKNQKQKMEHPVNQRMTN
ncbi:protein PLANT CADMIUM RESISTANCE 6-like [Pistacia vera]|uniref:protein PLANT CADMIUM RESISTANCE 6-like n=1 Tax=Pistacia vera TaxID=55513 RepID=UPI001262EC81|nr:protein PLANT CADMIUM RESISTANCE 6-like [Pistacia vera]